MTKLEAAVLLAQRGFHVFPITPGQKSPPLILEFPSKATRALGIIADWWAKWPTANVGISTSRFGDDKALLVVDVDVKEGKKGDTSLIQLELNGYDLPSTFTQHTPTGGLHIVYVVDSPVRQGVNKLGEGLDIRSRGGYIVGTGSTVTEGDYLLTDLPIVPAPQWLIDRCGVDTFVSIETSAVPVNESRATERAIKYLSEEAPLAIEGHGGDETTYKVAARCKDLGVDEFVAGNLMTLHWNPRCQPPWDTEELFVKVKNAYVYGLKPPAVDAPEVQFDDPFVDDTPQPLGHPFEGINKDHAFVLAGGGAHILWETKDSDAHFTLEHLSMQAFDAKFAPQKMVVGKRSQSISKLWMEWKGRREYDGLVFMPQQEAPSRFYNLWRGFAVEPVERMEDNGAVSALLEHAKDNVCRGDNALFRWLIGYFAQLVQRPFEKPLVALVFRGGKGVGKNAFIERIGALLGGHFLLTSNRRYLVGNFNGHLENCLLFVLDEAFWSGDKQAEGILKDLITGREHVVEHKGKEPYRVANKTRIVIIGNEDWLVPASYDERRFAVFDVAEGRKQDRPFFQSMRAGMEARGYRVLLRYLLDYDITGLDFNSAPSTKALLEQKEHTLEPFQQWWLSCLQNGEIICLDFTGWPVEIECDRLRSAYVRYIKERQIRSRIPDARLIGRFLKQCAPSIARKRVSKREDGTQPRYYTIPTVSIARAEWDLFIGHSTEWEEI
jgi:hypothetical protein